MKKKFWILLILLLNIMGCNLIIPSFFISHTKEEIDKGKLINIEGKDTVALIYYDAKPSEGMTNVQVYCSGIWVDRNHILTVYHCLESEMAREGKKDISVHYLLWEESKDPGMGYLMGHTGKLIKKDMRKDLALIEVKDVVEHGIVRIGEKMPAIGGRIYVCGHPKGFYWTFLEGVVAGYRESVKQNGKEIGPFMQGQVPIYFGDSGGGVFNENGELVGMADMMNDLPSEGLFIILDDIDAFLKS